MTEKSAEGIAAARAVIRIGLRGRDPVLLALLYDGLLTMEDLAARFPDEVIADPLPDILAAQPPEFEPEDDRTDPFVDYRIDPRINIHPDPRKTWNPPPWKREIQAPPAQPFLRFSQQRPRPTGKERREAQAAFARWVESGDDYIPGIAGDWD